MKEVIGNSENHADYASRCNKALGLHVLPIVRTPKCSVSEDMIDAIASLLRDEDLTCVRIGRY